MLIIRLARVGRKNDPSFRIVVQERHRKPTGKAVEILGFYNACLKEKKINKERVNYWIERGAQTSKTVHNLLVDEGVIKGPKVKASRTKLKEKPAAEESKEAAASTTTNESQPEAVPQTDSQPSEKEGQGGEKSEAKEEKPKKEESGSANEEKEAPQEKSGETATETEKKLAEDKKA